MNELERELFEERLSSIARGFDYPRAPDIAGSVITRLRTSTRPRFISNRLAWSLTLILLSSLLLITPVRASIIQFIQIGVVRIFPRQIAPTAEIIRTATPESEVPITAMSSSQSSTLIPILNQMAGETTIQDAQNKVDFPILLPAYPSNLGIPDHVFVQDMDGNILILVWLDPQKPDQILMSLHFVPSGSWAIKKVEPEVIQETSVGGQRAIWTTGPYPLILSNGNIQFERMIDGHVLIWADEKITYRLETGLPLDEAIKIAESLHPMEP